MARPVTLFTGQWADLTLEELARKCGEWGFDGLELACWGDHFDVDRGSLGERLRRGTLGDTARQRPELLGHKHPPGRPGGLRPHRRPPPGDAPPRRVGRRRSGRRAPACRPRRSWTRPGPRPASG